MSMDLTRDDRDTYTIASDALTRLTRDLTAAIARAAADPSDDHNRTYAFALTHLVRDLTSILADATWLGTTTVGDSALAFLTDRAATTPTLVPDWLAATVHHHHTTATDITS